MIQTFLGTPLKVDANGNPTPIARYLAQLHGGDVPDVPELEIVHQPLCFTAAHSNIKIELISNSPEIPSLEISYDGQTWQPSTLTGGNAARLWNIDDKLYVRASRDLNESFNGRFVVTAVNNADVATLASCTGSILSLINPYSEGPSASPSQINVKHLFTENLGLQLNVTDYDDQIAPYLFSWYETPQLSFMFNYDEEIATCFPDGTPVGTFHAEAGITAVKLNSDKDGIICNKDTEKEFIIKNDEWFELAEDTFVKTWEFDNSGSESGEGSGSFGSGSSTIPDVPAEEGSGSGSGSQGSGSFGSGSGAGGFTIVNEGVNNLHLYINGDETHEIILDCQGEMPNIEPMGPKRIHNVRSIKAVPGYGGIIDNTEGGIRISPFEWFELTEDLEIWLFTYKDDSEFEPENGSGSFGSGSFGSGSFGSGSEGSGSEGSGSFGSGSGSGSEGSGSFGSGSFGSGSGSDEPTPVGFSLRNAMLNIHYPITAYVNGNESNKITLEQSSSPFDDNVLQNIRTVKLLDPNPDLTDRITHYFAYPIENLPTDKSNPVLIPLEKWVELPFGLTLDTIEFLADEEDFQEILSLYPNLLVLGND